MSDIITYQYRTQSALKKTAKAVLQGIEMIIRNLDILNIGNRCFKQGPWMADRGVPSDGVEKRTDGVVAEETVLASFKLHTCRKIKSK